MSLTYVEIIGDAFHINGEPTYPGRYWRGHKIEGLLLNSRMVQGIFDDLNPSTRSKWAYPDDGKWCRERNTNEFVAVMQNWRSHGLLAFTINLQGGSPEGYSKQQPWHNSAFNADGSLRADYIARLRRVLDRADELGMVVILGYFYFGQDQRLKDEEAVVRGVRNATRWILENGYTNVVVEINNESDILYDHPILLADRVHELIEIARGIEQEGRRLLVGTSFSGGKLPTEPVAGASDFILIHGNGVSEPERIVEMARQSREIVQKTQGRRIPIIFNEDDHFEFDKDRNNFIAAIGEYASWGYFDYRQKGEGFDDGYQSVPVNWGISSPRKKAFFELLAEVTGSKP